MGVKLPYLRARTSKKDLATRPSGPDVGTVGHQTPSGKLRSLTKDISKEDPTCNSVYVAALRPTGSRSQDMSEETSEHLMQVKASKSDGIALSPSHYKIGYRKVATNSRDVSLLVRPPRSGKTPSNQ